MAADEREKQAATVSFDTPIEQLLKGSLSGAQGTEGPRISHTDGGPPSGPRGRKADEKPVEFFEGDRIGRFVLIRALGRGGMGLVFLAQDPELLREVALKVLLPEKSTSGATSAQSRMLREAQAMAMITHPHLVGIYEVGLFEDHVFLAMEYVIGKTLEEWLEEGHPLEDVMEVFDQAGRALSAVHKAGLVHRDFKPDNVMVTSEGVAKVLDLGIARKLPKAEAHEAIRQSQRAYTRETEKEPDEPPDPRVHQGIKSLIPSPDGDAFEGSLTVQGSIVGTPEFMAPEQLTDGVIGPHTDQFAFAIALFRALAKKHPFPGNNYVQVMTNIMLGERRPWPENSEAPEKLRAAIDRALCPDPKDRWPSMDAFLDACREGLGLRGQIRFLTSRWVSQERAREYLLAPGSLLDEGKLLLREQRLALTDEQAEFIMASARRVRRRKVQRRSLIGGVIALSLTMIPILSLLGERNEQLEEAEHRQIVAQVEALENHIEPILGSAREDLLLLFEQREAWMRDVPKLFASVPALRSDDASSALEGRRQTVEQIRLLNRYFRPLIERRSTISSLVVARDDEFELLFLQDLEAKGLTQPYDFYNRLVWDPVLSGSAFEVFWGPENDAPITSRLLSVGMADARGNPWQAYLPTERVRFRHAAARPVGEPTWTTPYLFFVTKDAGVTGSIHWMDGGHKYVLGVDFMLTDFSDVTTSIEGKGLKAVVVTDKDQILGLPRDPRFDSREKIRAYFAKFNQNSPEPRKLDAAAGLPTIADLGGPLAAAAQAPSRKRGVYSFKYQGKKLWAEAEPIGAPGLGLQVLVVQTGEDEDDAAP